MASYKDLVRVFGEQFVYNDGKSEWNQHPGGKILLNSSDPDAEIGLKGAGYQVQIAETCSDENDVQLITAAISQGGSASDMEALLGRGREAENRGASAGKMLCRRRLGSDENYVKSAQNGMELIAPAPPKPAGKVGLDECKINERKAESTDEFRKTYGHKRCPAAFHSIYAILTMHNIMQMVRHAKIQLQKVSAAAFFRFLPDSSPFLPNWRSQWYRKDCK